MTADTQTRPADHGPTAPTTHQGILDFVNEVAAMTTPDRIHWCTGSDEEWTELTDALVATRHLHPAQPREEAELLPRRLRPDRRRARRGPHLHLLASTRRTPGPPTTGWRPTR